MNFPPISRDHNPSALAAIGRRLPGGTRPPRRRRARILPAVPLSCPRHLRGHRGRHGPQRLRRGQRVRVNPLQITGGVPAAETGGAISFYQLIRSVAYSIASALSATILILGTPARHALPASAAYSAAALVSTAVLIAALLVSGIFAVAAKRPELASAPTTAAG
jgi:hypothetical protein